ncbi:unnamed protein product [Linum trigynum]|uniref:Putative plant transposon protein domain-containing protein n=1 Tax=Linum trigynum TaxID=586398 RepID=A0AAV2CI09_9ROSI
MSDHLPRPFRFDGLVHTYSGYMFHEPLVVNHHRYLQHFDKRRLHHITQLDPYEFNLYKYDIVSLIEGLRWDFLLRQPVHPACPGTVKYFYSNLKIQGISSRSLTTLVYGHLLTIPVEALNGILGFPSQGIGLAHPSEFWKHEFKIEVEYGNFSTEPTGGSDVPIPVSWLPPRLRIFHHFLTHVLFPRSFNQDRVLPMDLWIIASATARRKLDYSSIVFDQLLHVGDEHYRGLVPFGSLITRLLINLGVDLSEFRSISSTMYISALNVLMVLDLPTEISPPPRPSSSLLGPPPKPSTVKRTKSVGEPSKTGDLVFTISEGDSSSDDSAATAPAFSPAS